MYRIHRVRRFELFLYAIVLMVMLGVPFLGGMFAYYGWGMVFGGWLKTLPFVLVFLINNFLLVPKLLFREKYLYYILTATICVVLVFLSGFLLHQPSLPRPLPEDTLPRFGQMPSPPPPLFFNFGSALIATLLIGFNAGIKSFVRWSEERIGQAERDRQHYHTELAFLKQQVSPHFLMNTLNNIHALVDINAHKAKNAIIKLSHLMRYHLYEGVVHNVLLKREIHFIESYIELMRLRYDEESLTIETEYPRNTDAVYVPPSLFLSFIENAFKHGVSPTEPSTIKICFCVESEWLIFRITNNLKKTLQLQPKTTGIGLENVRKRLDLIYGENYTLDIRSEGNTYEVVLKIPVL